MVDSCPEGAGGGNVRHLICDPDGTVRATFTGYWKREAFLREFGPHDHEGDPEGTSLERRRRNFWRTVHAESEQMRGRALRDVLREIADAVYLEGRTG